MRRILFATTIGLALLVSGCSISFGNKQAADGGVFRSADKAESWQAKWGIATASTPAQINDTNISKIIPDPSDHLTLYLITQGKGLLYTITGGDEWVVVKRQPAAFKTINDLAVDAQDLCTLYAAAENKIFKSVTCSRDWKEIYYHDIAPAERIISIAVDWYNPKNIYAGTSGGSFLKSTDSGTSWRQIGYVRGALLKKILIDPRDSRKIYFASTTKGIFRTADGGATWQEPILEQLKRFPGGDNYRSLIFNSSAANSFILAAEYGLLKSNDGGNTWEPIDLLTNPKGVSINAVAVDQENGNGLYYVTNTNFYKSLDGGKSWVSKKLPSSRAGTALLVDFANPNVLYLGLSQIQQ